MRPVREITSAEESLRFEQVCGYGVSRRNPVKPEPEGTIVLLAFRVTGYEPDCDGSLMACLEHIDRDGEASGWNPSRIGLCHDSGLVVSKDELQRMFEREEQIDGNLDSAQRG